MYFRPFFRLPKVFHNPYLRHGDEPTGICAWREEAISTSRQLTVPFRLLRQPTHKTTSFPRNDVKTKNINP